eukprot:3644978-Pyramimonas_sp.AAC.1
METLVLALTLTPNPNPQTNPEPQTTRTTYYALRISTIHSQYALRTTPYFQLTSQLSQVATHYQ